VHCQEENFSFCDNTNPNGVLADKLYQHGGSALFGYSHIYGGYAGGQAEYIRVPFADVNSLVVPDGIPDEKVLFLSDIFPTGYMAAENADIRRGDTVCIWGAGPVGLMALKSAYLLGAERVLVVDHYEGRLALAKKHGAEVVNFEEVGGILDEIQYLTGGRGPDACIDAVGLEAHGHTVTNILDNVKQTAMLATDRPDALRQALQSCKKGGTVSIPGVYGGLLDKVNFGAAFAKGLTLRMGQTHTQRYMRPLLEKIVGGEIDPSFVITHRVPITEGPEAYKTFHQKKDECIKVIIPMDKVA
jgi:threonine dehydrogenase-like Zn-dependent dehydrogenase